MFIPFDDTIQIKQNLTLTMRERGKIVARREGHNIWLNVGREWIAKLLGYSALNPDTPEEDNRIKYMGLGIGGTRQNSLTIANSAPLVSAYPGNNTQTDTDATVVELERPVQVSDAVWILRVQAPVTHDAAVDATFVCVFNEASVSYSPYLTVPVSEIGLFTAGAAVDNLHNVPVAYDTFDSLSKTSAFSLEAHWTIHIG